MKTRAACSALAMLLSAVALSTGSAQVAPELPELRELEIVKSSIPDAPRTVTVESAEVPAAPTRIVDPGAGERLFRNEGVTLQWIGWEKRGKAWIAIDKEGHWLLTAQQKGDAGQRLDIEGFVTEIGATHLLFEGTIKIIGTPDAARLCNTTKAWRFEITQKRSYYRLREFEWCDGLTDYIDIYLPPARR